MKISDSHTSAKAVMAFLIVIVAFSMLVLFEKGKDNILTSGNLYPFVILAFIGSSLLLALLFFVNQQQAHQKIKSKKRKR